jgi:hypothetical protein
MFRKNDSLEFVNGILRGRDLDLGQRSLGYQSTNNLYRPFCPENYTIVFRILLLAPLRSRRCQLPPSGFFAAVQRGQALLEATGLVSVQNQAKIKHGMQGATFLERES